MLLRQIEAFAAQAIAVVVVVGSSKRNVNGGAYCPRSSNWCQRCGRILVSLLHEMKRQEAKAGLATLCIGGGMGEAMVVKRP